ncbi:MAG: hypothetical protein J7M14_02955 [Planctomycetes bacterium]|nr:hypothetical protein [Planctomycetota bacterium]
MRSKERGVNPHIQQERKRKLWRIAICAWVLAFLLFGVQSVTHIVDTPAADVAGLIGVGGMLALAISCSVGALSSRPIGGFDGFRIGCWVIFGCGVGSCSFAKGYEFYWEEQSAMAMYITRLTMYAPLILAMISFPVEKAARWWRERKGIGSR